MKKFVRIGGRAVRVDLSKHAEDRARERGVSFDAIVHVLEHGAVITHGSRPVQAFKLAENLAPSQRFGPFARFRSVFTSDEVTASQQGLLVSWSIRDHKYPLHVDTRIVSGEIVVTTVYFTDDTAKWHVSGLATNASWARHGSVITAAIKDWSVAVAATTTKVA